MTHTSGVSSARAQIGGAYDAEVIKPGETSSIKSVYFYFYFYAVYRHIFQQRSVAAASWRDEKRRW